MVKENYNLGKKIKFVFNVIIKDISALGSLVFFGFMICFQFVISNYILSLKLAIGLVVSYLCGFLIRSIYYKPRPDKQKYSNWLEKIDSSSFPSMHSTRIMILSLFLVFFYSQNIFLISFFFFVVLGVGFSRYYMKRHYLTDIIAGYVLGVLIYLLVEFLFRLV